jgi:hypothetical protein
MVVLKVRFLEDLNPFAGAFYIVSAGPGAKLRGFFPLKPDQLLIWKSAPIMHRGNYWAEALVWSKILYSVLKLFTGFATAAFIAW